MLRNIGSNPVHNLESFFESQPDPRQSEILCDLTRSNIYPIIYLNRNRYGTGMDIIFFLIFNNKIDMGAVDPI